MDLSLRARIIAQLKALPHKKGVDPNDWDHVVNGLLLIAISTVKVAQRRRLPILITSIIRGRIPGVSESDTHATGRAFDMSIHGWSVDDIDEVLIEVNAEHAKIRGAYKRGDPTPRALIYEHRVGEGPCPKTEEYVKENSADPHLHGQCRWDLRI
jgi:hypothetical protein